MSGVRASKAAKLQAQAQKATTRTRKGRNKVPKISRTDAKKKGGKFGGNVRHAGTNAI